MIIILSSPYYYKVTGDEVECKGLVKPGANSLCIVLRNIKRNGDTLYYVTTHEIDTLFDFKFIIWMHGTTSESHWEGGGQITSYRF